MYKQDKHAPAYMPTVKKQKYVQVQELNPPKKIHDY